MVVETEDFIFIKPNTNSINNFEVIYKETKTKINFSKVKIEIIGIDSQQKNTIVFLDANSIQKLKKGITDNLELLGFTFRSQKELTKVFTLLTSWNQNPPKPHLKKEA